AQNFAAGTCRVQGRRPLLPLLLTTRASQVSCAAPRAGVVSATLSTTLTQPFDVVRTVAQVDRTAASASFVQTWLAVGRVRRRLGPSPGRGQGFDTLFCPVSRPAMVQFRPTAWPATFAASACGWPASR